MGFSLVGPSGDQSTTSNVYETNYSASLNPQLDLQNSGAGATAISQDPLLQGSNIFGGYSPLASSFFAPINITSAGDNSTPAQIAALGGAQAQQIGTSEASGSTASTLSSLLSGNGIYYVLGGIVLLFLAHHKH